MAGLGHTLCSSVCPIPVYEKSLEIDVTGSMQWGKKSQKDISVGQEGREGCCLGMSRPLWANPKNRPRSTAPLAGS